MSISNLQISKDTYTDVKCQSLETNSLTADNFSVDSLNVSTQAVFNGPVTANNTVEFNSTAQFDDTVQVNSELECQALKISSKSQRTFNLNTVSPINITEKSGYFDIDVNVAFNVGDKYSYTLNLPGVNTTNNCMFWLGSPDASPAVAEEMCEKVSVACAGINGVTETIVFAIANHSTALYGQSKVYVSYMVI
jgi:hypothetical protein